METLLELDDHPALRDRVHLARADLYKQAHTITIEDLRVQALVAVGPRQRDVVPDRAWNRLEVGVDVAKSEVAGVTIEGDHLVGDHVAQLLDSPAAVAQLVDFLGSQHVGAQVDRAEQGAPPYRRLRQRGRHDPRLRRIGGGRIRGNLDSARPREHEHVAQHLDPTIDVGRVFGQLTDHLRADLPGCDGLEVAKGKVRELAADPVDAQQARERCVDVCGLPRDSPLLRGRHGLERAHVVDAIAQLDEQHADVAAHRHEQLSKADRLVLPPREVGHFAELGDSVDEQRDLAPEALGDLDHRQLRVLHGVMEDARDHAGSVETDPREHPCDPQRMHEVRVAALAHLSGVTALCQAVGLAHGVDGVVIEALADLVGQGLVFAREQNLGSARRARHEPIPVRGSALACEPRSDKGDLFVHTFAGLRRRQAAHQGSSSCPSISCCAIEAWRARRWRAATYTARSAS